MAAWHAVVLPPLGPDLTMCGARKEETWDREGRLIAKDLRGEKLKSAVASLIASSSH
jgi:hypothetical protein